MTRRRSSWRCRQLPVPRSQDLADVRRVHRLAEPGDSAQARASAGSVTGVMETGHQEVLGRDGWLGSSGTPLAPPVPLPVLGSGSAPDAVNLVMSHRELQAFPPDPATRTDYFGSLYLPLARPGRGDGKEQVRVGGQAGACGPPVHNTPGRGHHHVSSRGSELGLCSRLRGWSALTSPCSFPSSAGSGSTASLRPLAYTFAAQNLLGDSHRSALPLWRGICPGPRRSTALTSNCATAGDLLVDSGMLNWGAKAREVHGRRSA